MDFYVSFLFSFLEKLTEFLRLFLELHFHRLEVSQTGNVILPELLNVLFKYTFDTDIDQFYRCASVWPFFFNHLQDREPLIFR